MVSFTRDRMGPIAAESLSDAVSAVHHHHGKGHQLSSGGRPPSFSGGRLKS